MKLDLGVLRQSKYAGTEKYFISMHNADSAMRVSSKVPWKDTYDIGKLIGIETD